MGFLNLILLWQPWQGLGEVVSLSRCPFPLPEMIQPCECFADQNYKVSLICDLQEDLTEEIWAKVTGSLVCTEIDSLVVNLNNNSWKADFGASTFGLLDVKDVIISNASLIEGNIEDRAFDSASKLSNFVIEESAITGANHISGNSFSKLRHLQTVNLGNNFANLRSSSFSNLTKLTTLEFSPDTLQTIEEGALSNLPSLKKLDLSHQLLKDLPKNFVSQSPNLTDIDLSYNALENLHDESFSGIGGLSHLDLSHNQLAFVGLIFEDLDGQDLVVDLSNNSISFLPETSFKPFIEKKRKGFVNLSNNELLCGCEIQWLLTSNLMWNDLFKNASCGKDIPLEEVDGVLLDKMCPTTNCPLYDDLTARYKQIVEEEEQGSGDNSEEGSGEFICANGNSIRQSWLCDNDNDCGDYSDEINC